MPRSTSETTLCSPTSHQYHGRYEIKCERKIVLHLQQLLVYILKYLTIGAETLRISGFFANKAPNLCNGFRRGSFARHSFLSVRTNFILISLTIIIARTLGISKIFAESTSSNSNGSLVLSSNSSFKNLS